MASQRIHEFNSALLQVRFLRAVLPYGILILVGTVVWDGFLENWEARSLLVFVGIWVCSDIISRYSEWRQKAVNAELESLDREIAAEIDRLTLTEVEQT
ncbi:MAG: hypothetical protein AAFY31_06285 [Pseudomonadota bacterium]